MKTFVSFAAVLLLVSALTQTGYAAKSSSDIKKEMDAVDQQAHDAAVKQKQAQAQKQQSQLLKERTQADLSNVLLAINDVSSQLARVSNNLSQTETGLRQAKIDLAAAKQRIQAREGMIDTRVRMMYTDGMVSYLDVLMSSTNFSDFLARADSLRMIVEQDQDILQQQEQDKQAVIITQKQLNSDYALAKSLYAEKAQRKQELNAKEHEKEVLIAKYNAQIENADDISAHQEQQLWALADQRASLYKEKTAVEAQEREERAQAEASARAAEEARRAAAARTNDSSSSGSSDSGTDSGADSGGNAQPSGSGMMTMPVVGARISSPFGYRIHPITGEYKMHTGVDLAAPQGTPIYAADSGTVVVASWMNGYGNVVIIDHGNGIQTLYAHIRNGGTLVHVGQTVERGQQIAEVGSTGNSTGPHCHFEVRINGTPVDPMGYL
ncbi:peptidoglycan DD-metalloendopeptidase family protein [Paenibacillus sp. SGZ-1009]|uniref:peptidoglycan DD-metalloendopeptidase family protein n=1 Tax=Paenibacillus campi TaxID=3106031 RepID=UPI002AFFF50A|nr:peptidoglycan DD-metalloendopeptidase family protein [Paenibacillus sp. SGZ-1009]